MSITANLSIKPVVGRDFHYDFIGSIDANCAEILKSIAKLPPETHVLLDFAKVERVNSMGLSLLLKLFEEWELNKVRVEVQNLNRMVNMLFKITGLGRFVKTDGSALIPATSGILHEHEAPRVNLEPARALSTKQYEHEKLNFVASLQSGHQLTGWYLLNTYLQRRLKRAIHFEQSTDVPNGDTTDLLFAKPFEACHMMKRHGFLPIMRPLSETDEVVLLTRIDDTQSLQEYEGVTVGTATEGSFVYLLGRFLCDENGLDSSKFTFDFAGNEIKALQMLIRRKCDLVFMLKKTYEGLSSFSRSNVRKLDESVTDFACHLFCVAPHLVAIGEELSGLLAEMEHDEQGQQILNDIQIQGWTTPQLGELQMLQMVYDRYIN